jgi:hypothetical protein
MTDAHELSSQSDIRPIVFSTPMINAIRAGTKTQTRRVANPQPRLGCYGDGRVIGTQVGMISDRYHVLDAGKRGIIPLTNDCKYRWRQASPYGDVGDRLWVRETWAALTGNGIRTVYKADGDPPLSLLDKKPIDPMRWNSPRFMPRTASRLTLLIKSIRIERLQAISDDDAKAEGVESWETLRAREYPCLLESQTMTSGERMLDCPHRASFAVAWDDINGHRGFDFLWSHNPWVWVVEFSLDSTHEATFPGRPPFKSSKRRPTPAGARRSRSSSAR